VLRGWVREQIQLATLAEALPLPAAAGRQHRLDRACSRSDQLWASPRHSLPVPAATGAPAATVAAAVRVNRRLSRATGRATSRLTNRHGQRSPARPVSRSGAVS